MIICKSVNGKAIGGFLIIIAGASFMLKCKSGAGARWRQ